MTNLFGKVAVFSDIHFGKFSDSEQHNEDCIRFIEWFCQQVQDNGCDTIIIMGDWFDNRSRLGVNTIHYSHRAIQMLQNLGLPIYLIVGNHDMFLKNSRSIHSLEMYHDPQNQTHVVDHLQTEGDCLFVPYLVGTEFNEVPSSKAKYIFGHLELSGFMMNDLVEMPDHGGLQLSHFEHQDIVFSGHFHNRQVKTNRNKVAVWYIGNPFGHNFNDNNDRDRGCMILKWGEQPRFLNWTEGPFYIRIKTSELGDILEQDVLNQYTTVELHDDADSTDQELMEIRDLLNDMVRTVKIIQKNDEIDVSEETNLEIGGELIDIVSVHISNMEPRDEINPDFLVELLRKANEDE